MSRVDKKLAEDGFIPSRELHVDGDPKLPLIFKEYVKKFGVTLWADNARTNLGGKLIVQIFAHDIDNGKFAIRSEFEEDEDIPLVNVDSYELREVAAEYALASGGDRGYGYILRGMSEEDIKLMLKKLAQIRRKYKRYRRFKR